MVIAKEEKSYTNIVTIGFKKKITHTHTHAIIDVVDCSGKKKLKLTKKFRTKN